VIKVIIFKIELPFKIRLKSDSRLLAKFLKKLHN